jgi:hypothetical protein
MTIKITMSKPEEPPRRYRWPWFVAAAVALAIVLAVLWMFSAVKKLERERDVNGPLPSTAPLH